MFKTAITASPLIGDIPNELLGHISGEAFRGDVSTVTTLRCFFGKRAEEGQGINTFIRCNAPSECDESDPERYAREVAALYSPIDVEGDRWCFWVHGFTSSKELNDQSVEKMLNGFTKAFPSYKENTGIAAFYRSNFPVACFYNEELKNVILFVSGLNLRRLHFIQASLFPMFPWFRTGDKATPTELDIELIKSLTQNDEAVYNDCVKKFAGQFDFRSARIRKGLVGFETFFEKERLAMVRREIDEIDTSIDMLNRDIMDRLSSRHDRCVEMLGLEAKISQEDRESEIMDYFLCNKSLNLVSVSGSTLNFVVKSCLEYFDSESAETVIANRGSSIYKAGEGFRKLMKAILIDETLKVHFCSAFNLDLKTGVKAIKNYNYTDYGIVDCIPNPHLDHYSCLGNNVSVINGMIRSRDYIGAIEQCVAASKNWNVLDTPVTASFIEDLKSDRYSCIELPDGRIVRPSVAIKWLEEQENEQKETEE